MRLLVLVVAGTLPACTALGVTGEHFQLRQRLQQSDTPTAPGGLGTRVSGAQGVPEAKQKLRICSAYTSDGSLDVALGRTGQRLGSLRYKACEDFAVALEEGDRLLFKAKSLQVGVFAVSGLPTMMTFGELLLVVRKRPGRSLAATFQSHAFEASPADAAQVAVLDASPGVASTANKVRLFEVWNGTRRNAEYLSMNSVTAIVPGSYQVALGEPGGDPMRAVQFNAQAQTSYVVLRVGENASQARPVAYPEEVIVFPQTNRAAGLRGLAALLLAGATLALGHVC